VVLAKLNAAFRHISSWNAHYSKTGGGFAGRCRDFALQGDRIKRRKAHADKPGVISLRVSGAERNQMCTRIALDRVPEFAGDIRIPNGCEEFKITPPEHGTAVAAAGSRWLAVGLRPVKVQRERRQREAELFKRTAGFIEIRHEMANMIQELSDGDRIRFELEVQNSVSVTQFLERAV
jgi:hypothetical protein